MTIQDVINCTGFKLDPVIIFDKFNCLIFSRNDLSARYILRGSVCRVQHQCLLLMGGGGGNVSEEKEENKESLKLSDNFQFHSFNLI